MTGIERLRAISGAWDEWGLGGSLTEIADQIERELARHGEPDSTDKGARLLYVTDEDREAAEWVRKRGGLDHVRAEWNERVPRDLYQRRRQRLLGHIAECETALGRRRQRIEELGKTIEFFQLNNSNFRHLLADVAERLGSLQGPCEVLHGSYVQIRNGRRSAPLPRAGRAREGRVMDDEQMRAAVLRWLNSLVYSCPTCDVEIVADVLGLEDSGELRAMAQSMICELEEGGE